MHRQLYIAGLVTTTSQGGHKPFVRFHLEPWESPGQNPLGTTEHQEVFLRTTMGARLGIGQRGRRGLESRPDEEADAHVCKFIVKNTPPPWPLSVGKPTVWRYRGFRDEGQHPGHRGTPGISTA